MVYVNEIRSLRSGQAPSQKKKGTSEAQEQPKKKGRKPKTENVEE